MFRIGDFSRLSKTTIKTLRYYDEEGLLKPEKVDLLTSYRYYTTEQLVQLHRIQSLRQAGLSVAEIKAIRSGSDAAEILQKRKTALETDLAHTKHQLSCIEFLLAGRDAESAMTYSAIMKDERNSRVHRLFKKSLYSNLRSMHGTDSRYRQGSDRCQS